MDKPKASRWRYPSVVEVTDVLALAPPIMPWKMEAPARHRIRVLLILQGMQWDRADWLGHSLVARARIERGVGQPRGYDSDADLSAWIPTEACPICDRMFRKVWPEQICCSTACSRAHARNEAIAIARVGLTSPPKCQWCGGFIEFLETPWQIYCSDRCYQRASALMSAEAAEPELGVKIRNARLSKPLLQRELAAKVGITGSYVTMIERGSVPIPDHLRPKLFAVLHLDEHGDPTEPLQLPVCPWCLEQLPPDRRSDARFCSYEHQRKWFSRRAVQKLKEKRAAARAARTNGHCGEEHRPDGPGDSVGDRAGRAGAPDPAAEPAAG